MFSVGFFFWAPQILAYFSFSWAPAALSTSLSLNASHLQYMTVISESSRLQWHAHFADCLLAYWYSIHKYIRSCQITFSILLHCCCWLGTRENIKLVKCPVTAILERSLLETCSLLHLYETSNMVDDHSQFISTFAYFRRFMWGTATLFCHLIFPASGFSQKSLSVYPA